MKRALKLKFKWLNKIILYKSTNPECTASARMMPYMTAFAVIVVQAINANIQPGYNTYPKTNGKSRKALGKEVVQCKIAIQRKKSGMNKKKSRMNFPTMDLGFHCNS